MTALHEPVSASSLLEQHQHRVDLIQQCANEASVAEFERKWLAILERCAAWFSSVPLGADLYREPGGAFRATVETAFYAMRLAGGQKFGTNLSSEKRRRIEPQYNYAVFLAAVCSRLDEPYRHFIIERDSDRAAWNPSVDGAAGPWLGGRPYRVARRPAALPVERMRTGMLAQMLIGSDLLAGLDHDVLAEMFGAINPNMKPLEAESLIHKVIRQAVLTAAEFDRKAQQSVFEPVQFAVPSAVHVAAELQPSVAATPVSPAPAATASAGTPASVETPTDATKQEAERAPTTAVPLAPASSPDPEPSTAAATTPEPVARAVDPAVMRPVTALSAAADNVAFDEVLKGAPNMILELFRALREDVATGNASVQWTDKGLAVQKRLIGSYGVASDTLVEHLRKRSLLLANGQGEITLAPRAGQLILGRSS
jgi:conjugal transfer pilus assembly protein TraI